MAIETTENGDGGTRKSRLRATIGERAARREYLETHGKDRYDSLLRHLRAGREISIEPTGRWRVEWHPVALRLVIAAALIAAVYLAITFGQEWLRDNRVDAWSGAVAGVESGQRLASCPEVTAFGDPVFPNWIRFDGGLFVPAYAQLPIGTTNIGSYYHDAETTLSSLRVYRVTVSGLGEPGTRLLVRAGEAPAGQLYRLVPGCS